MKRFLSVLVNIFIFIAISFVMLWCSVTGHETVVAIMVTFFVLLGIVSRILISRNPFSLKRAGRYLEAIECYKKQMEKNPDNKELGNMILYNIAGCYFCMGEHEKSIKQLEEIDVDLLSQILLAACYSLYAANLLMLEKDLSRAEDYINSSLEIVEIQGIMLRKSYLELLKGNNSEAFECIQRHLKSNTGRYVRDGKKIVMIFDKVLCEVCENFYLGFYYYKADDLKLSKKHFRKACRCKYINVYSKKSRELLDKIA